MATIRLTRPSADRAEELVARVWRELEEHDVATPGVSVEVGRDHLTIGFTFKTEQDAVRIMRSVEHVPSVPTEVPHSLTQAQQWNLRAEEYRAVADQMNNPSSKATFRRMAQMYERMAQRFEHRAAGIEMPKEDRSPVKGSGG